MKRILISLMLGLFTCTCAYAGPVQQMQGQVLAKKKTTGYPVDGYVDFENGNNTDSITTAIMNAGTHLATGNPGWTLAGTGNPGAMQTISTSAQKTLHGPVKTGTTIYADGSGTRGFQYDPGESTETLYTQYSFPSTYSTVSYGGYYYTTSTTATPLSIMFGVTALNSDYVVPHWVGSATPALRIKTGDSGSISISTDTWYWITGVYVSGGTNQIWVFNTDDWTVKGVCTVAAVGTSDAYIIQIGRFGADAAAGVGKWLFDNIMWRYDGAFPLVPGTPKVNTPTHDNDTGTYYPSVTVTPSDFVPGASIYYCTDSAGTCTPSTLYTEPLVIDVDGTHLRTLGRMSGWSDSAVKDSTYTIQQVNVTFDATSFAPSSHNTDVTTTLSWAHTCTGDNRLLIVATGENNTNRVTSVTYNGDALAKVTTDNNYAGTVAQSVWYMVAPDAGANTIEITYSASQTGFYPIAMGVSFTNVNQAAPFGTVVKAANNGTTPSATASSQEGGLVVDVLTSRKAPTKDASQDLIGVNYNSSFADYMGMSSQAGAASVVMSWSQDSGYWANTAIPIAAQ